MNRAHSIIEELRAEITAAPLIERASIIGQIAALAFELLASSSTATIKTEQERTADDEELLDVKATAKLLGTSAKWVYQHSRQLPRVTLPGSAVRFSSKRLAEFIRRRSYT